MLTLNHNKQCTFVIKFLPLMYARVCMVFVAYKDFIVITSGFVL